MSDVKQLIKEARGFTAGSNPENARTRLINDLADALESAEARIQKARRVTLFKVGDHSYGEDYQREVLAALAPVKEEEK